MKTNKAINLGIVFATLFMLIISSFPTTMSTTTLKKTETMPLGGSTLGLPLGVNNMTFTSDITLDLTTGTTINIHTGRQMRFTTGITFVFQPAGIPVIEPCFYGSVLTFPPPELVPCSWWEVLDPSGNPTGFEFHVDTVNGPTFHVDQVIPGPFQLPWPSAQAELKIDSVKSCDYFIVRDPPGYVPPICSWWEITYPQQWAGVEFHVDSSGGYEFHVDQTTGPTPPIWPWPYYVLAELKIDTIEPCDTYVVTNPAGVPAPCSWWEVIYPTEYIGYEFHVDTSSQDGTFHIDIVTPHAIVFPMPVYEVIAEKKISSIEPCTNLKYISPSGYIPRPCDWWEIIYPISLAGHEFHIDTVTDPYIHIDDVYPHSLTGLAVYKIVAERKIKSISMCDWFKVTKPAGWAPDPCSWWKIIEPAAWSGITFHVDQNNSIDKFHVDTVKGGGFPPLTPPPWSVTAEPVSTHDVAVTAVTPLFASVYKGWPDPIDVTVQNEGDFTETFSVSVYYDSNHVTTSPITVSSLPAHTSQSLRFWWIVNAPIGIYTISARASAVPGETDLADNIMIDGTVTVLAPPQFYYKAGFADYAPSGMPDFDQRQDQWDNPPGSQTWTWCGPVAAANSLWWLDSKFEPAQPPISPPTISDGFPLVTSYIMGIDDHDPANVQPLVQHLAYLMDTDGIRTHLVHSGTNVIDMESGLTHYLSWTGVNPQGDVNGDGTVDMTDVNIVNAAMGTMPGMPGWNMAADIFPATIGWPVQMPADNVIDMQDLTLVMANLGRTGLFYEHTVDKPDFRYIEQEVEKSQDVVLLLGYWYWTGSSWYREGGHYVTVAGVNSTQLKLAISDPVEDAFERGIIAEGRVPIPHMHPPIEPPYMTHNDAAYVSHDIYNVMQIGLPFPPCPGGTWTLMNYAGWKPTPPFFTVIESAVITSPLGTHDVAVINVHNMKRGCIPRPAVCQKMNCSVFVTVENQGDFTETFNVTAYANTTAIGKQTITLNSKQNTTLTFIWMTSGFTEYTNYTISATADFVWGEADFVDNTLVDGTVTVTHVGDITGDGKVDIQDLSRVSGAFGSIRVNDPKDPQYGMYKHPTACPTCPHQPNTDLTGDKKVDVQDLSRTSANFGWHR